MTKRFHRRVAGMLPPRRFRTDTRYSVDQLDGSRQEYGIDREQRHREAAPDDPWLSPAKSEAIRALLVLIEFAQAHTYYDGHTPDNDYDLREFCELAGLTEKQTEAACLIGEGWGVAAIAEMLEISRQAVSLRLHYGRRKLVRLTLPVDTHLQKVYLGGDELSLMAGSIGA